MPGRADSGGKSSGYALGGQTGLARSGVNAMRTQRSSNGRTPAAIPFWGRVGRGWSEVENSGGIPKRPTGADCKSAGLRLRWFESTSLHQFRIAGRITGWMRSTDGGSTKSPGAILNVPHSSYGPGGAEGRMRGVIHLPPPGQAIPGGLTSHRRSTQAGCRRGSSSMVEHQFSKLITRVRFPPSAPLNRDAWTAFVESPAWMLVCSSRSWRTAETQAHVAQSVEHLLGKEEVIGSIPIVSTSH